VLDYKRFSSDALLDFMRAERAVLDECSPGVLVTTNFMTLAHFRHLDYAQWTDTVDVVSTDHYIVDALHHPRAELAYSGDLTRGLAGGAPWMLMEHSTSAVNWQPVNHAKAPGQTIRDALAHVARGADTIGWFQWRQSRAGAEKFHSAVVPHAGPDSARFREVEQLGRIAGRLGELVGSRVEARVAILHDYQAIWASEGPCMPSSDLDALEAAYAVHRVLQARGVTADVVHPTTDLSGYDVIVVPQLYTVTDAVAGAVGAAAEGGAQVVVTYFSGISDEDDHVRLGGYPGAFRDLLGVRVEEFFPLDRDETVALSQGVGTWWSEDVTALPGTEVLRTYASGPLAGRPAVTRRDTGGGAAWYLSTLPDDTTLGELLGDVLGAAGVAPAVAGLPPGVEATRRVGADGSWLFLLNHTDAAHDLVATGYDLVADRRVDGVVALPPGTVAVVRED
jgi:beta-galactosidase